MENCETECHRKWLDQTDISPCPHVFHLLALAAPQMSVHLSKKTRATITQAQKLARRLRSVALREELNTTVAAYHDSARKIAAKHARHVIFVICYHLHQHSRYISRYIVPVHWVLSVASYTCQSKGRVRRQAGMVLYRNKLQSITMVSSLSICLYNLLPSVHRPSTGKPYETEPVHERKPYRPT